MLSLLPSIVALGLAAVAALVLALNRRSPPENVAQRSAAARALTFAVCIQALHFVEESVTGFNEQFPGLFDLPAMPFSVFVVFNLAWLAIWAASIPGLRAARTAAFFAAWFLAIAGTLNGVAHPVMAIAAGEYSPGLLSSPVIGAASVWVWFSLQRATRAGDDADRTIPSA